MMEKLYEQTSTPIQMRSRGELRAAAGRRRTGRARGRVPAGLAAGPPGRRGRGRRAGPAATARWSVDVTVAARPGPAAGPAARSRTAGLRPGAGHGGPGDQLRRAGPGRARRLPAAASSASWSGHCRRSRSAPPPRTSWAASWSPPTSPDRRSPAGWSRCSAPGCCRTSGWTGEPYRSRLAALLGATTTGYARALQDRALDDQETIVRASMIARAEAERALRDSEERRWHEARHDPLTGLPNRLGLTEQLARTLDRAAPARHDRALPARPGPVPRAQRHARAGHRRPAAGDGRGAAVRARRRPAAGPARRRRVRAAGAGRRRPGHGRDHAARRAGRSAAAGRADPADRDRERRADRAAGRRARRRRAAAVRRHRADLGQVRRPQPVEAVRPGPQRRRHRPLEPGRRAAGRGPGRRARGALPADDRAGRRPAARRRGAGPVATTRGTGCCCPDGSSPPPRRPDWSCRWAGRCSPPPAPRPRPGPG